MDPAQRRPCRSCPGGCQNRARSRRMKRGSARRQTNDSTPAEPHPTHDFRQAPGTRGRREAARPGSELLHSVRERLSRRLNNWASPKRTLDSSKEFACISSAKRFFRHPVGPALQPAGRARTSPGSVFAHTTRERVWVPACDLVFCSLFGPVSVFPWLLPVLPAASQRTVESSQPFEEVPGSIGIDLVASCVPATGTENAQGHAGWHGPGSPSL